MALPPGTTTFQLTYGAPASGFGGESLSVSGTITPSASLTHRVTGAPLVNFVIKFDSQEGMPGATALPHTEQFVDLGDGPVPAYLDKNGNGFNNWAYLVEGNYRSGSGESRSFRKVFQAPPGQTSIDLDLLPEGDVASFPVIAPILPVTDFGGETGSVSAMRAAELVSPYIEGGGGVADGGVTTAKLAEDAVTADKIAPGAVNGPELGQDAVTASKIANDAVSRAKLAEALRLELDGKLTEAQADTHYAPVDDPRFDAIGGGSPISVVDNGDGTITINDGGSGALVDNGDGTATLTV